MIEMRRIFAFLFSISFALLSVPMDAAAYYSGQDELIGFEERTDTTSALIFGQEDVAAVEALTGTVASGGTSDLYLNDQKTMQIASGDGENRVELAMQFFSSAPADELERISLRFWTECSIETLNAEVSLYNWETGVYDVIQESTVASAPVQWDVEVEQQVTCYVSPVGEIEMTVTMEASAPFLIDIDQAQMILSYYAPAGALQVQNYSVESGQIETGVLDAGSDFTALSDRDKNLLQVTSEGNRVAWNTTIPLYQPQENIRTLQIDYAGSTSIPTNTLWLSLYRYDTENWEVVGTLQGTPEYTKQTIFLSGEKIQSYLSDDGDVKIRIYNSATQSFVRQTDFLSLTVTSVPAHQQKVLAADYALAEYGNSTGGPTELANADGNCYIMQSDANNKAAVQLTFYTDIKLATIRELSFSIKMRAADSINPQYISLLNHNTGRFSVIKTVAGSNDFETIYVTLDSLLEIENYIGDGGEIVLRIYNSAKAPFEREIDFVQASITYGDFESFTVAQISDVHELTGTANFKSIISEINNNVNPAFSIITGDISDHGTPEQYALFLQDRTLFEKPVYTTPGNHDVRWWNANGKRTFSDSVGPLYQSFDYNGVHFVLLDSTVNFELDGKINKAQLDWLKDDLASISADMPVIMFAHHPFKINNNVTARHELLDAVKGHNVIAYMSGHVHYYGNVIEDGIPVNYITYVKDNTAQEFVSIEFTPNYYYIFKHKASDQSKTLWLTGRMDNTRQMDLTIDRVTPLADGTVEVEASVAHAPDGVASMQVRIDNYGPYTQMTRNSDETWTGYIDTTAYTPELVAGTHFVGVEAFDENGLKWTQYQDYSVASEEAYVKWVFSTGDMLQASATIHGDSAYVGSNDGVLYCIDTKTGLEQWSYPTAGAIISKPAITDENGVIFGSSDETVYCLDASTGTVRWTYKAGGSLLSDVLVENNRSYIGCGDEKIYCLDASSGEYLWSYQTDGLMRQQPIIENGVLYAFVRDTYIWYAIDAQTGELVWRGNAGTDESYFVCGDVRPVIAGGKLWCIDAQNTRPGYLNMETGELSWTGALEKVSSRGMATDGTRVFYASNNGRQITAYDAVTAEVLWQKDLRFNSRDGDLQEMQIDSGLVYSGGVLFHLAERGRVSAIDPLSGDVLWKIDVAGYPERVFWATPEVEGNLLLGSGIDGNLYAVEFYGA